MHADQLAIQYLEQVTDLATEMFMYIAEEANATNSFINTLIAQGYKDDSLFHFHNERMVRSQNLVNLVKQSQKTLKELQ